jgi:glyoxylase I family protein
MHAGFHHVCVKTRDWDRTLRFYAEVLGCAPKAAWRAAPERATLLELAAGNYIEVFEDLNYQGAANGSLLHFAVRADDVDAIVARARAFGAPITVEPKSVTIPNTTALGPIPIRIAFCTGPNGEVIEFFQNTLT